MKTKQNPYMTPHIYDDYLSVWIDAFLTAKRARGMSKNTILFYTRKLKQFNDYCEAQAVKQIEQLTPSFIREFLLWLETTGHNPGGRHAAYRAVKTFLYWYENENEPEGWSNPIRKVKPPRVELEPLEGVPLEDVRAMLKVSNDRDKAILLCLLDTGCRAREFLSVNVEDVNPATGEILIRRSKGKRPRYVYIGRRARQALRHYLKQRTDNFPALWLSRDGERLSYSSLREVVVRRAKEADIKAPALHDFRRSFAIHYLRNGGDIFTLQKLMGHKDLTVLRRYLALTDSDTAAAHAKHSPVDSL